MKKSLFLVLWSLILVSGLCGVFSINESPSGHVYNPSFDQCESYTIVPIENSITIYPDDLDSTISATTIYSTDGAVPFTIESLLFAYGFEIRVDDKRISNIVVSGWDVCFTRNLGYGHHGITIDWYDRYGHHYSNSFDFLVTPYNHYYQNSWSKLYPYSNGSSSFGAVRPALIVEGFSIPGLIGGNAWSVASKWDSSMSSSKRYILTFSDPYAHVQDNAMVVLGALRFIHNSQTTPLVEGTSIYGYSMGGVLARYALAYAEQWNIQHFCTQYVSIDSPHRGATINLNLQNTMQSLENALDDYNKEDERLNAALSALNSPAAKQLIRENKNADNNSYNAGSLQYRSLFAEINEEDNIIHELLDGDPMSILNASPDSYEGALKPGFPYKQNNVKSFAYSNGGLGISGNVNNDPLAVSWSLDVIVVPNDSGQAAQCEYDRQPGSVLEDFSTSDSDWCYDFDLIQNYAPVLVPTRSSLYLKSNSISGGTPIPELGININYLSALTDYADDLLDHTYFDQIVHATDIPYPITEPPKYEPDENGNLVEVIIPHKEHFNEWSWRHGELGWSLYEFDDWVASNIATSTSWLNQIENRSVCMIKGQIDGSDFSNITGTILINGQGHGSFSIDQNGFYSIPYLYTKDATVRLVFEMPGCIPSHRDLNINYSDAMLQDQVVQNTIMYALNLNDIRVSSAGNGSFYTINQAIDFVQSFVDSGLYAGEAIRIRVLTGTYNESVDLSPIAALGITNFTIEGEEDVTLAGNGTGYGFFLYLGGSVDFDEAEYKIKMINITGFERGIVYHEYNDVDSYDPVIKLTIDHCNIYGCGASVCTDDGFSAGAIHFEGTGTINGCKFWNNSVSGSDLTNCESYLAGALYLKNNSSNQLVIRNCHFDNNSGGAAGAIMVSGVGKVIIGSNSFNANDATSTFGSVTYIDANDISVCDAPNKILISHNIFKGIQGTSIGLKTSSAQQDESGKDITLTNNTISFDVQDTHFGSVYALKLEITSDPAQQYQSIQCQNNVFICNHPNICKVSKSSGYHPTVFDHNILHNVTTAQSSFVLNTTDPSQPLYNLMCDPKLDSNLTPIWTATTMSPCIDSGVGTDDDETPADIGAYPTVGHAHESYTMPTYGYPKWMSFPVLNRTTPSYDIAENFFAPIISNDILDKVIWKIGNNQQTFMYIDNYILHNGNTPVQSVLGYKVILRPEVTQAIEIPSSGFVQSPNTIINLYAHPAGSSTGVNENWIGYFLPQSSSPFTALASVLDKVTSIRTQYWSAIKGNGFWKVSSANLTLNYGDMVIITVTDDCSFAWGNEHPVDPKLRSIATAFEYEEKLDYTPMFIDLSGFDVLPSEIGLYVDGECKGAVKVEGNYTDLCAYLDKYEVINPEDCELVLYFDTKEVENVKQRCRLDSSDMKLMSEFGIPHYEIAIKAETELNPIISKNALSPNYPNPFNPETTISYEVASDGIVKLDIFNLKGQLVKTLVNENKVSGPHKVVWNGTDKYGRKVASGIYQYRLTTKDGRITKKMMLMK